MAIVNLICLVEYPIKKGIEIREHANILNLSETNHDADQVDGEIFDLEDNEEIPNIQFGKALRIPGVLTFSLSFFFIKFAYYGVYYWVPTYLRDDLGYSKDEATNITSLGSAGGIVGSLIMGLLSDLLSVRSPVHTVGCAVGALCLSLITTVHDSSHTGYLTFLLTSFSVFEGGATIVISIILCDIGKDYVSKHQKKAIATISGICDGLAGFGSILG